MWIGLGNRQSEPFDSNDQGADGQRARTWNRLGAISTEKIFSSFPRIVDQFIETVYLCHDLFAGLTFDPIGTF